jgi:UDP-4-amino-4,6-dideoxy-N-acetyl-beta-L-altrosamine transaminase|tara:strand:+ start:9609 stop:10754 length:1146 start_codon:yes stop_codon:yes gene_type:complete
MIPYGRQEITQEDIDQVTAVLKSDFLTQGPQVPVFEKEISNYCGSKHAIAVNSSTSALHIACMSLGLGKGDWLWTSPVTFVASANCGIYCGANVDFVDIDPHTYNLCPKALEAKLIKAKKQNCLPKIVIPVHLCGQSCDMKSIHELSQKYGFKIIEDASHAVGGRYLDKPVGSCEFSDIAVFSFHPVKIITTGEGGMAMTNNTEIAKKMSILRTHGITRDPNLMTKKPDGDWYYQQIELGHNYRITDIQAALGISQFKRINDIISKRHFFAKRYDELLSDLPLQLPYQDDSVYSAFHLYVILLNDSRNHKKVFDGLRKRDIGVNLHYIPVYRHPYYSKTIISYDEYPESEKYYSSAISIPLYPSMSENDQDEVIDVIKDLV